jgi:AcrR family transcriptional regulator
MSVSINKRKEIEKLNRKNMIIDGAEKVFFKNGFEVSTVDDIAFEAEFTKKTIYSYFSSKEEIYYEIMLRGFTILNTMSHDAIKKNIHMNEIEKIKVIGNTFIDFSNKYPGYFKTIVDYENNDLDVNGKVKNSLLKQCYEEGINSFKLLKKCVLKGIEKGEIINKDDAVTIALVLWSCILGFINILDKKEKYIKFYYNKTSSEIMEESFKLILNSIKK